MLKEIEVQIINIIKTISWSRAGSRLSEPPSRNEVRGPFAKLSKT